MNAERQLHGWQWLDGAATAPERKRLMLFHKRPRQRVRRHADWMLELALMLVLSLLLPRCRRSRK